MDTTDRHPATTLRRWLARIVIALGMAVGLACWFARGANALDALPVDAPAVVEDTTAANRDVDVPADAPPAPAPVADVVDTVVDVADPVVTGPVVTAAQEVARSVPLPDEINLPDPIDVPDPITIPTPVVPPIVDIDLPTIVDPPTVVAPTTVVTNPPTVVVANPPTVVVTHRPTLVVTEQTRPLTEVVRRHSAGADRVTTPSTTGSSLAVRPAGPAPQDHPSPAAMLTPFTLSPSPAPGPGGVSIPFGLPASVAVLGALAWWAFAARPVTWSSALLSLPLERPG
jgi:hypothetical protein